MVNFGGSFRSSRLTKHSPGKTGAFRSSRVGNGTSRFGGSPKKEVESKGCVTDDRYRQNTPWQKNKQANSGWGSTLNKAIFGDRESRRLRKEKMKEIQLNKAGRKINRSWREGKMSEKLLGAEIKVDRRVKPGDVKYNYRKNVISISEVDGLKKKELPKQIIKLAQSSRKFRETTGVDVVTAQKKRIIKNMFRHKNIAIGEANKKLQSSSVSRASSKSSRRKVKLGKLVNKRYQ